MSEIKGLEYSAGIKAPVQGDAGKMPVVNATGTGFEYLPTGEVISYDVSGIDETYAQALGVFMETEEVKSVDGLLVFAPRSRFAVFEDYFMHGFEQSESTQVGALRWSVLGTVPAVSSSVDVTAPGKRLTFTSTFTLSLGPVAATNIVDPASFTKMSFMHAAEALAGSWFLGMMDGGNPTASTNAVGFSGLIGFAIQIRIKSSANGDQLINTGVNATTVPQAFKMLSVNGGTQIEFYIDGVLVLTANYAASARLNPQMLYETPAGSTSVVPMYFSLLKTCGGAMLLDGNRD